MDARRMFCGEETEVVSLITRQRFDHRYVKTTAAIQRLHPQKATVSLGVHLSEPGRVRGFLPHFSRITGLSSFKSCPSL